MIYIHWQNQTVSGLWDSLLSTPVQSHWSTGLEALHSQMLFWSRWRQHPLHFHYLGLFSFSLSSVSTVLVSISLLCFYTVLQNDVILVISDRANSVLFTFLPLNFLYKVPKSLLFRVFPNSFLQYKASAVLSWRVTSFLAFLNSRHGSSLCLLLACYSNLCRLFMSFLISEEIQGREFDLTFTFSPVCGLLWCCYTLCLRRTQHHQCRRRCS